VPGGPPPFYLCACWALATLSDQSKPMPVEKMFVLAMDKSIIEWRQQTTLLPMIQMNPIPFPYYRNMVLLIFLFEVVVALKIALDGSSPTEHWSSVQEVAIDTLLFAAISLLCQSLFLTSVWLLNPWQHKMGHNRELVMPTHAMETMEVTHLPAEFFLYLPYIAHRRLFSQFGASDCPADERSTSMFLNEMHPQDSEVMSLFLQSESWKMMQILHASFRTLSPKPSSAPAPSRHRSTAAMHAAIDKHAEAAEEGSGSQAEYHLLQGKDHS